MRTPHDEVIVAPTLSSITVLRWRRVSDTGARGRILGLRIDNLVLMWLLQGSYKL